MGVSKTYGRHRSEEIADGTLLNSSSFKGRGFDKPPS